MDEFKIEKGVPVPPIPRRDPKYRYPFGELQVGDYFFVPNVKIAAVGRAWSSWRKRHPDSKAELTMRSLEAGVGVWRVA